MKKWLYNLLLIFFSLVLIGSVSVLAVYYIGAYRQASRYDSLSGMKAATTVRPPVTVPDSTEASAPTQPPPAFVTVTNPQTGETLQVLPEFGELYTMNHHLVGWLTVPGTPIDYPVMQTPDSPDYYLKRNFDREYSSRGCLYAREVCDVFAPSDNITIYGHRMRDGSMLARLDRYMDETFAREHPYLYFDTLTQLRTYQVMAVFLTTATEGQGFDYHLFVDTEDPEEFDAFVASCKRLSLYDTGVEATLGDSLITLSTCEYSQDNGRLVLVAKRVG